MRTRVRLALALVLALAAVSSGCGSSSTLRASSLAKQAAAVQSLAAEGALLAGDTADGRTVGTYRRAHASELSRAAGKAETSLASAKTTAALAPQLRSLHRIAARVTTQLARLGHASNTEARSLAGQLQHAADASQKIGDDLG